MTFCITSSLMPFSASPFLMIFFILSLLGRCSATLDPWEVTTVERCDATEAADDHWSLTTQSLLQTSYISNSRLPIEMTTRKTGEMEDKQTQTGTIANTEHDVVNSTASGMGPGETPQQHEQAPKIDSNEALFQSADPLQQALQKEERIGKQYLKIEESWQLVVGAWIVAASASLYVWWSVTQQVKQMKAVPRKVVSFIILSIFVRCIDFSIVLPTVYDLVKQAGGTASFSGLVIGAFYATAFIGVILLNSSPLSGMSFRRLTLGCLAVLPVSSCLYVSSSLAHGTVRLGLMTVARGLTGVVEGILSSNHPVMLARLSPASQLVDVCALYTVSESLGTALGPMVSSAWLQNIAPLLPKNVHAPLLLPVVGMCFIHCAILFVACIMIPENGAVEAAQNAEEEEEESEQSHTRWRSTISGLFVVVTILTYCMSTALESATALALEVQYYWSDTRVGYAIGLSFSFSILIHLLIKRCVTCISDALQTFFALICAIAMVWFWLPQACPYCTMPQRAMLILLSDAVIYGMLTLTVGNTEGIAMDFGTKHLNLIAGAFTCFGSLCSATSPAFARHLINVGGMEQYALAQLLVCGMTLFVCMGAVMAYQLGKGEKKEPDSEVETCEQM